MTSNATIISLIQQSEGQHVEFKTSFAEQSEAIRTLCAFANAKGGTVLIGVTDDHEIIGVQLGKNKQERFANDLSRDTQPKILPSITSHEIEVHTVIALTVEEPRLGDLYYAHNRAYIRVGNTNQSMSAEEQRARLTSHVNRMAQIEVSLGPQDDADVAKLQITNRGARNAFAAKAEIIHPGHTSVPWPIRWRGAFEEEVLINHGSHPVLELARLRGSPRVRFVGEPVSNQVPSERHIYFLTAKQADGIDRRTGQEKFRDGFINPVDADELRIQVSITAADPPLVPPYESIFVLQREANTLSLIPEAAPS